MTLPFTHAAYQRATHAYIVDYNASVPFLEVPIYGAMLCMAKNRAEFISLALQKPLPTVIKLFSDQKAGDSLIEIIDSTCNRDLQFAKIVQETATTSIFSRAPIQGPLQYYSSSVFELFSRVPALSVLALDDGTGRGGPLSSEEAYNLHRNLFLGGKITGAPFDMMSSADMSRIQETPGVIYISNVEEWLQLNDVPPEKVHDFYKNMSFMAAKDTLVIHAMMISDVEVEPVREWISGAIPLSEPPKEAGGIAIKFIPPRIYLTSIGGGNFSAGMKMKLITYFAKGTFLENVFVEIAEVIRKPISPDEFDSLMVDKPAYKSLSKVERNLLKINLLKVGVLNRPEGNTKLADELRTQLDGLRPELLALGFMVKRIIKERVTDAIGAKRYEYFWELLGEYDRAIQNQPDHAEQVGIFADLESDVLRLYNSTPQVYNVFRTVRNAIEKSIETFLGEAWQILSKDKRKVYLDQRADAITPRLSGEYDEEITGLSVEDDQAIYSIETDGMNDYFEDENVSILPGNIIPVEIPMAEFLP